MRTQRTRENGENRVFALVYVRCLPARPQKLFHESLVQKPQNWQPKQNDRWQWVGVGKWPQAFSAHCLNWPRYMRRGAVEHLYAHPPLGKHRNIVIGQRGVTCPMCPHSIQLIRHVGPERTRLPMGQPGNKGGMCPAGRTCSSCVAQQWTRLWPPGNRRMWPVIDPRFSLGMSPVVAGCR